jgi:ribosomal protein S18 acetylase RimI-like enzyme
MSDGDACGCVALGKLTKTIGEMRTLFVRPAYRGMGVGKKLARASLHAARDFGYRYVRLDTLAFMNSALTLYRSLGFYEIAPYRDISASLKQHICFLELKLSK